MLEKLKSLFTKTQKRHTFTDTDRLESNVRRKEIEIRNFTLTRKQKYLDRLMEKMKEQELDDKIEDMEDQLYGDDEEESDAPAELSPDALIIDLLAKAVNNSQPGVAGAAPASTTPSNGITDEMIRAEVDKIPDNVLMGLLNYEDSELKKVIKQKYNTLNDKQVETAIAMIREEGE